MEMPEGLGLERTDLTDGDRGGRATAAFGHVAGERKTG